MLKSQENSPTPTFILYLTQPVMVLFSFFTLFNVALLRSRGHSPVGWVQTPRHLQFHPHWGVGCKHGARSPIMPRSPRGGSRGEGVRREDDRRWNRIQADAPSSWDFTYKTQMQSQSLLYLDGYPTRAYRRAQGTLLSDTWQPGWEGDVGENGHMDMHGRGPLLSP